MVNIYSTKWNWTFHGTFVSVLFIIVCVCARACACAMTSDAGILYLKCCKIYACLFNLKVDALVAGMKFDVNST